MKYKKVMLPLLLFKGFWGESSDIALMVIWQLRLVLWCIRAALECVLVAWLRLNLLVVFSFSFLKHEGRLLTLGIWRKRRLSLHLSLHLSCNSGIFGYLQSECLSFLEVIDAHSLTLGVLLQEALFLEVDIGVREYLPIDIESLILWKLHLHLRELGQLLLNFSLSLSIKKLITFNFSSGSSSLWTCFH